MANYNRTINLLNTNLISKTKNNEGAIPGSSNISISQLEKILAQNFNNIVSNKTTNNGNNLELLGEGINGTIYKIKNPDQEYICKCINYSKENQEQIDYEINLLENLQGNPITVRYVNPCLGIVTTDDHIITIFPRFQASTLDQIIKTMKQPQFNTPQRVSLIKYLIYQMILGLAEMHKLGICHRQINENSILVEVKNNNSTHKPIDEPWYSEDEIPLRVKYTNFGFGCLNSCLPVMTNIDPYQPTGPVDFENSKKYDIWCLGAIFGKLIHDPDTKQIISEDLDGFVDVINNYMLVPMDQRKPADYVKDMLAINDKLYDELGSDGRSESEDLIQKVLKMIK